MQILKFLFLILLAWKPALAAPTPSGSYILNADHIEYGKNDEIIVAKGKVEILKDGYTLTANKIIYDKNKKTAYAYDNVLLINPDGEKTHAKYLELNNDLKEGLVENLTSYLKDNEILIAKKAEYKPNKVTIFRDAKYTPCPMCENKAPQWQIKARKATYISKETITFKHGVFEIYGVPIFYTPYLKIFAPNAPPRSGFLIPKRYKYKDIYGHSLTIPIYFRIADDKDLLYYPMVTSKQGLIHQAKFRHLIKDGYYELQGDYVHPRTKTPDVTSNRYHIKGNGTKTLNDTFTLKAKIDSVSDKSYLHNYWDINENYLTSDATIEYDKDRDYGYINSLYFQNLRNDIDNLHNPIVLPLADYHKEVFHKDNKFSVDVNLVNLLRKGAQLNTKRLSTTVAWYKHYILNNHNIDLTQRARNDVFNFSYDRVPQSQTLTNQKKDINRFTPESEIMWSYPLIALKKAYSLYIKPMINPIISPNSSKNRQIINEDSNGLELKDTNIFNSNRFAGYDQVEHGNRVNYGFIGDLSANNRSLGFVIGQVLRQRKDKNYPINSGMHDKKLSDYVGNFSIQPFSWLSMYYRFRADDNNFTLRKQELDNQILIPIDHNVINSITVGNQLTKLNYIKDPTILSDINKVISLNAKLQFLKNWFIEGSTSRNYTKNKNFFVQANFALGYTGKCSSFKLTAIKDFTHDPQRNIKPNNGFTFDWDIHLKNIN